MYLLFTQGPPTKYQFRMRYNSTGAGDRSTLNLNALQILEGSEKLYLSGRLLERGTDYTIAYETGLITFLNPDALFGSGVVQITARFEERGIFAVAPTSIFGLTTHYDLGRTGGINFIGIYQRESSAFARPALGFEASANLVAGVNTSLHFRPTALSRLVSSITNRNGSSEAFLDINGEFAFTQPDPNRTGQAYLEEFEGVSGTTLSLGAAVWQFGSVPQSTVGLDPSLGFGATFDTADAVQMIWQNLIPGSRRGRGAVLPAGHRHAVHHQRQLARTRDGDVPDAARRHRRWRRAAEQLVAVDPAAPPGDPALALDADAPSAPSVSTSPA